MTRGWRLGRVRVDACTPPPSNLAVRTAARSYPERQKRTFIFPVGQVVSAGWGIGKRFLDPGTGDKILILTSNYRDTLSQFYDADQLEPRYGGTGTSVRGLYAFAPKDGAGSNTEHAGPHK